MISALVVGSAGLVEHCLVKELLFSNNFISVVALVRKKQFTTSEKLKELIVDFNDPISFNSLKPVNRVFCCLGTTIKKAGTKKAFKYVDFQLPIKFATCAQNTNAKSFSIVTSLGANADSKNFYNKIKGETGNKIKQLNIPIIQIFKPSLILGKRKEIRIGELAGKVVFSIINPLMIGLLKKYRAAQARSIAKAIVLSLKNAPLGIQTIESYMINKF